MTHYICTGTCKGVSDKPGTCQAKDCPKYEEMLQPCDCIDGKHYGRQTHDEEPPEDLSISERGEYKK